MMCLQLWELRSNIWGDVECNDDCPHAVRLNLVKRNIRVLESLALYTGFSFIFSFHKERRAPILQSSTSSPSGQSSPNKILRDCV